MIDDADLCLGRRARRFDALLQGRTLGLIAMDGPCWRRMPRWGWPPVLPSLPAHDLGSMTLAVRRGDAFSNAKSRDDAALTLMLLGPVGDDHGRVKGALRALGARCGQTKAMLKSHDADTITTIRLGLPVRAPAAEAKAELFDATKLGTYCVLLRDEKLGGDLRLETRTGPSFFSRRAAARRLDTSAEPSSRGV